MHIILVRITHSKIQQYFIKIQYGNGEYKLPKFVTKNTG